MFSIVTDETAGFSGLYRDQVYFSVVYRYEEWYISYDGFAGMKELY